MLSPNSVHLMNGRFGDPSLYIALGSHHAILFDCGDCSSLTTKELSLVERLFLTHTHVDHLFGFDRLLRICIDNRKRLEIYGAPGIRERLEHKMQGVTHNLDIQRPLEILIVELHERYSLESTYLYNQHFRRENEIQKELEYLSSIRSLEDESRRLSGEVFFRTLSFQDYEVHYTSLLHVVPVLSFKLSLRRSASVLNLGKAKELGLTPGSWISTILKKRESQENLEIQGKTWKIQELFTLLFEQHSLDVLGYITDTVWNGKVRRRLLAMMSQIPFLFCDSTYLAEDQERALKYYHLTATQAGELAKQCKVGLLITFHFSLKYGKNYDLLIQESTNVYPAVAPLLGKGDEKYSF
jgi:ribonuclease Z